MPDAAGGYSFDGLSDKGKGVWGSDLAGDPAIQAVTEMAHAAGWSQRRMDDVVSVMNALADKGLIDAPFDPAAELQKLGANGSARVTEAENYVKALQARGEIDAEMAAELTTLTPTAAGVKVLEWLQTGKPMALDAPATGDGDGRAGDTAAQAVARAARQDPRYDSDPHFRRKADQDFRTAFS